MENKGNLFSIFSVILIAALSIACYSNSIKGPFHYDDRKLILTNFQLRDVHNLYDIVFSNPTRGISNLSFALNYWLDEFNPAGYHLVNLSFHASNGILVYLIFKTIFPHASLIPLFSSLVFVSHPVNVESVTYISSRAGVMSTVFFMLSFYFFIKFRNSAFNFKKKYLFYSLMLFSYILSVGSKEIGITLPVVLILYEFCFPYFPDKVGLAEKVLMESKLNVIDSRRNRPNPPLPPFIKGGRWGDLLMGLKTRFYIFSKALTLSWSQTVKNKICYLPFLVIILTAFIVRYYTVGTFLNPTFKRDIYINYLTQINATISYIKLLFLPTNLNIDHDFPLTTGLDFNTLFSSGIILFIFYLAFICFKKHREISFSILWFFITLSPTSVIPLEDVISERWLYLPSIGFSVFLSMSLYRIFCRGRPLCRPSYLPLVEKPVIKCRNRPSGLLITGLKTRFYSYVASFCTISIITSTLILIFFSIATYQRNLIWNNGLSLWQDAVKKSPKKARPYNNLGVEYMIIGKDKEAFVQFERALKINPYFFDANSNIGTVYERMGKQEEAYNYLKRSLMLNPQNHIAHNNLGNLYKAQGKIDLAITEYKRAIELNPDYGDPHYNLGIVYHDLNRYEESEMELMKAISLDHNLPNPHIELGLLFLDTGRSALGLEEFRKALELDPNNLHAHNNLGILFGMEARYEDSEKEFEKVLKIDPSYINATINLGIIYFKTGRPDKALVTLKYALNVSPNDQSIYYYLGQIYFTKKQFDEALEEFRNLLALDPNSSAAYNWIGKVYQLKGLKKEAIKSFEESLKREPHNKEAEEALKELKK